jgi:rod shape-determining protein MreC
MTRYPIDRSIPPLFKRGFSLPIKLLLSLVCSITLILFDSQLHALSLIRENLNTAFYPFQVTLSWTYNAFKGVAAEFAELGSLSKNNQVLRKQMLLLEQKTLHYEHLENENIHLRQLLGLQQISAAHISPAEILYETRDPYTQKIIVSPGSEKALRVSMPVIDQHGLLGQITRVFPLQSEVTLITDRQSTVPVKVLRTGLRALVSGAAKPGYLELRFVPAGSDVQIGDTLVTSGLDGTFPPGLPVATVTYVQHQAKSQFAFVLCLPTAQLSNHRQIMVLDYASHFPAQPPGESNPPLRDRKGRLITTPQ